VTQFIFLFYGYSYIIHLLVFFIICVFVSFFVTGSNSNPTPRLASRRASWSEAGRKHVGPVPRAENPEAPPVAAHHGSPRALPPSRTRVVLSSTRPPPPAHAGRSAAAHPSHRHAGFRSSPVPDVSDARRNPPECSGEGVAPYHVGDSTGGTGKRGAGPAESDAADPVTAARARRP
jgi:hypothetical protein